MARRPGSGKTSRQAPGAISPASGIDRRAKTPGIALPADLGRSANRTLAKAGGARSDRAAMETGGQERLILAAFDSSLGPPPIAKVVRVSRLTVQHVITDAKRDRRSTEL